MDPLALLERSDKWFVGGGRSSVYAPPAPLWDRAPGFWDECHLAATPIPRLFTFSLLDEVGRPIALEWHGRSWRPDRLRQEFGGPGLRLVEQKVCLPPDVFVSSLELRSERSRVVHLVLWSWQPCRATGERADEVAYVAGEVAEAGSIAYTWRRDPPPGWSGQAPAVHVLLGGARPADSFSLNLSEGHPPHPDWRFSMLPEKWRDGGLAGDVKLDVGVTDTRRGPAPAAGNLHMALHWRLELPAATTVHFAVGAALAFAADGSPAELLEGLLEINPAAPARSETLWRAYLAGVPQLSVADPFLQTYYWYRWYQLRIHEVDADMGGLRHPCVMEGIGPFRNQISYSAHAHIREQLWRHDPAFAAGSLLNMLAAQRDDGWIPGTLNECGWRLPAPTGGAFYHARWSNLWDLYLAQGDRALLQAAYAPLARYADYFAQQRDPEASALYDVIGQDETGQEFMSRYQAVEPHADDWGPFRLKGVDATCYLYELLCCLAAIAQTLGRPAEAAVWTERAHTTATALHSRMWDAQASMFSDLDPQTGRRTGVKAAVCFYPFMSDLAGPEHLSAIHAHLLSPAEFWAPWPVPATSMDDPLFSPAAEWKGKRHVCPWNGRVWPMTNSHLCAALARAARKLDPALAPRAVELIRKTIELLFWDHDPTRPNTFEHYNPLTGQPSAYRAIDDYQHSWVIDLLLRELAGIQPEGETVLIDPLPFGLAFRCADVRVRGQRIDVAYDPAAGGFSVALNGQIAHQSQDVTAVRLVLV